MPHFASVARLGLMTTAALLLGSACGGQSFTGAEGGDAGSTSGGGSTGNHAGSGSTAGKGHAGTSGATSTAGTGAGGTSTAGTGAGGTGSGGVGGEPSEACSAPPNSGNCNAYIPSWYNDASTGICRPFVYGGCGGNANRYPSREACQNACPGGSPNYDGCNEASDCMITGTGCCGICDSSSITLNDLLAYNRTYAGALQCGLALDAAAGGSAAAGAAPPIACAPCAATGQGTLKYFVPQCVAGQCMVEDLRTSAVTACKADSDCKLRHGSNCCEGCSIGDVISVRNDGSFEKLVCGNRPIACTACVPPPTSAIPVCLPDNHCGVAISATAG